METTLVLLHTEGDGSLGRASLETVGAARELGGAFAVGLVGADPQAAADGLAGCGAARFLAVGGAEYAQPRYASDAAAAEALCRAAGATLVLAPHTARWARSLAGAAHRLGGAIDTHVTGIARDLAITRWYYRQRMEAAMAPGARPWLVLLDPGCHEAWSGPPGAAAVETVAVSLAAPRTTVCGVQAPPAEEATIRPDARLLFVAGAGWTKKQPDGQVHAAEAESLIRRFLELSQASLGGSKSLVDLSGEGQAVLRLMTHLNQVGQTGSTPRHPKGLSTCCHGEEPHVVGWRFIRERRAVNLDPNCGWARGKADVLYVADAFAVMEKVNELLAGKTD